MKQWPSTSTPEKKEGMTLEELELLLTSHTIPLDKWGIGNAKNVSDLLSEINLGESTLTEENGELIRHTRSLAIDVYCEVNGEVWKLKEEKQVFTDGRVRERSGDMMDTSLGEKLKEAEDIQETLIRAVQEELSLPASLNFQSKRGEVLDKERESASFPGIKSRHRLYYHNVLLPEDYYKPEGYVETQPTKSTYSIWERADKLPDFSG